MSVQTSENQTPRLLGAIHLFASLCFFVFGGIYLAFVDSVYMLVSNTIFGVLCGVNWLVCRRFGPASETFSYSFLVIVYVGLLNVVVHLGEHDSPLIFWGLSITIAAAFVHRFRGLVIWSAASLAFLPVSMWLKRSLLVDRAIPLDHDQADLLSVASYVGLTVFVSYAYLIFRTRIDSALTELESRNDEVEEAREDLESRVAERTAELEDAYETINQSETLLRGIVENIPDMVFVKDAENLRFVRFNQAGEQMIGIPREEMLGKTDHDFFGKEIADFFTAKDRETLARGELVVVEQEEINTRHQGQRILRTKKVPIVTDDGQAHYLLGISEDITDKLEQDKERQQLQQQLQQAQRSESLMVLTGGIAHDFNNLLVGIGINIELALMEFEPGSPNHEGLTSAYTASKRAAELVKQMLAYAGGKPQRTTSVDVDDLVREMLGLLKTSMSKKTVLRLALASDLPGVRGDATQLRQVVMNLITNAGQAVGDDGGEIIVTTELVELGAKELHRLRPDVELPAGSYVLLRIEDSGPGLPEGKIAQIFEPFFTTKAEGSGLGLAAAHGIVRGHQGAIVAQNRQMGGASFSVYLPAVGGPATIEPEEPPKLEFRGKGTFLIIDDEQAVLDAASRVVQKLGFAAITALDGEKGIDAFREASDEIVGVLLDAKMPKMDGEEVFRELKALNAELPVLLCTGFANDETTARLLDMGLWGLLPKPYELEELRAKIREMVR